MAMCWICASYYHQQRCGGQSHCNDQTISEICIVSLESKMVRDTTVSGAGRVPGRRQDRLLWTYIDLIYAKVGSGTINQMSPRNQYEIAISIAKKFWAYPVKWHWSKFSLALRANSQLLKCSTKLPKIESDSLLNWLIQANAAHSLNFLN